MCIIQLLLKLLIIKLILNFVLIVAKSQNYRTNNIEQLLNIFTYKLMLEMQLNFLKSENNQTIKYNANHQFTNTNLSGFYYGFEISKGKKLKTLKSGAEKSLFKKM